MNHKIRNPFILAITKGRFLFLLISILLMLVISPLIGNIMEIKILMDIFFSVILITGVLAVGTKKHHSIIAILLALPMLSSIWIEYLFHIPYLRLTGKIFGVLFVAYTIVIILSFIVRVREVTRDVIYASIVVYLLLGVMWAFIYSTIEILQPGSFSIVEGRIDEPILLFLYYSFITLTTLGYGDITPLTEVASSFSLLEAVIGQIYLTVLIAMLVGVYISQHLEKSSR